MVFIKATNSYLDVSYVLQICLNVKMLLVDFEFILFAFNIAIPPWKPVTSALELRSILISAVFKYL